MIKGVSRQVVVVKPSGSELFEEVVFILKEGAHRVDETQVLKEACEVANDYVTDAPRRIPKPVFLLLGALVPSVAWLISAVLR